MRKFAPVLLALVFGAAAGYTLTADASRHPIRDDYVSPETIELYRAARGELPEVADTVQIRGSDGSRPQWTVRLRYGTRIITYRGEAVNHPPTRPTKP